jgi:hypothetical protein
MVRHGTATSFADYDEETALAVVEQLLNQGVVEMPDDDPYLKHHPSGLVFDQVTNLAHFHRGWRLAHETEATDGTERDYSN